MHPGAEMLKAVRKKERLRKKAKRVLSDYHWEKFRRFRTSVKSMKEAKRRVYFKIILASTKDNPKRFCAFYQAKYKSKRIPNTVYFKDERVL